MDYLIGEWIIEDFATCKIEQAWDSDDEEYKNVEVDGLEGINKFGKVKIGKPHPSLPSFADLPTSKAGFQLEGELQFTNTVFELTGDLVVFGKLILQDSNLVLNTHFIRNSGKIEKKGNSKIIGAVETLRDDVQGTPTLAGNINIEGDLRSDGIIALGASPGSGLITGDLTLLEGSEIHVEFAGTEAGTEFDYLEVGGAATLAGDLYLYLIDDYEPVENAMHEFLKAGSFAGGFEEIKQENVGRSYRFDITSDADSYTATAKSISIGSYEDWKTYFFNETDAVDDLISGPNADPDKDGLLNFVEYATGGFPGDYTSPPFELSMEGGVLSETAIYWAEAVSGYEWTMEQSSDLTTWVALPYSIESTEELGERSRISISTTPSPESRFFRFKLNELEN